MASIIEMPELVLDKIIGFSDFKSVAEFQLDTSPSLSRFFIDDLKDSKLPDSKFSTIEIGKDDDNNIRLTFQNPDYSRHQFVYSEILNSRSFNGKTTYLKNENVLDVAIRDLERALKFQKSTLRWTYFDIVDPNLQVKLSNMFKKLNRKIKTEILDIKSDSLSGFMSVLPFADPEALESLKLFSLDEDVRIEMDEIANTEQWSNAESIYCNFYALNMTVDDICHFSTVFIKMRHISTRDLDMLKKALISSSNFKGFKFQVSRLEHLSKIWGPSYRCGSSSKWYFRIKNSEEQILLVKTRPLSKTNINFEKIESRDVPNGAIVHDYNEN